MSARAAWPAVAWLGLVVAAGALADLLPLRDPTATNLLATRQGLSAAHWLGTDGLGRDVLARMAFGARIDLAVALGSAAVGGAVGCTLGIVAGYLRGWPGTVIMRLMDGLLAFPALILAFALAAFLGPSLRNVIIVISVAALPAFVRISRASALQVSEREFVLAAEAYGATRVRVIVNEIWPNIRPTLATFTLLFLAVAVIVEGLLSFLGAGVPAPQPSWGGMIAEGITDLTTEPLTALVPTVALFLTVLSLNVLAERSSGETSATDRVL